MLDVLTLLERLHRPQMKIASTVDFLEGEWGEIAVVGGDMGITKIVGKPDSMCYQVFSGTAYRSDVDALNQATVLYGAYIADTDMYDTSGVYTLDGPLTIVDGLLAPAVAGDVVYAWVVLPPASNPLNANCLRFTTERLGVAQ
jgi:hypothetical protein